MTYPHKTLVFWVKLTPGQIDCPVLLRVKLTKGDKIKNMAISQKLTQQKI